MRRAFARVGAAPRLVASRLFQLAKIDGRLKELRPLSQSRLLSGPNNESVIPAYGLACFSGTDEDRAAVLREYFAQRQAPVGDSETTAEAKVEDWTISR